MYYPNFNTHFRLLFLIISLFFFLQEHALSNSSTFDEKIVINGDILWKNIFVFLNKKDEKISKTIIENITGVSLELNTQENADYKQYISRDNHQWHESIRFSSTKTTQVAVADIVLKKSSLKEYCVDSGRVRLDLLSAGWKIGLTERHIQPWFDSYHRNNLVFYAMIFNQCIISFKFVDDPRKIKMGE